MSPKLEINNSVLLHLILWVGLLPWLLRRKASAYTAGDLGLIPGSGRSPAEGNGNPLQYSCLEKPMDGGAWWATIMFLHCLFLDPQEILCLPKGCVSGA